MENKVGELFHHVKVLYLFQDGIQQSHVVFLCLDSVAKEEVGLVGLQCVYRNLLDADNQGRLTDVLLNMGANVGIGLQCMDSADLTQHMQEAYSNTGLQLRAKK